MTLTRRLAISMIAVGVVAGLSGPAWAFPDKPVSYVIPFGEGGESDISAKLQVPVLKQLYSADVELSYQPGGGGALAWETLNTLNADGHTIMGVNLPHIALQPRQENSAYRTGDITPVYWFHYTPHAIAVRADSPFKTLADLVEFAQENPEALTFSGSGTGSANHLAQVMFDKLAGTKTRYIPFKGTGAASAALNVEQVLAQWAYTTTGIAHRAYTRLLAVAMEERHPAFPDVPTFRELGFEMVGGAYRGIAVPAETPEPVRRTWSDMIAGVNADPGFRAAMERAGFALVDIPYEGMDAFMAERIEFYEEMAMGAGIL